MPRTNFGHSFVSFCLAAILGIQPLYPIDRLARVVPVNAEGQSGRKLRALARNSTLSKFENHFERRLPVAQQPENQLSANDRGSGLTDDDIFRRGAFGSLVPTDAKIDFSENQALAAALSSYSQSPYADDVGPVLKFIDQNPNSRWNTSLQLNVGITYRNTGHFSQAASAWQSAWLRSQSLRDPGGRVIADAVLGRLATYYAYIGDEQKLGELLDSVRGRTFTGYAAEEVSSAAAQLSFMRKKPEYAYRCGALALYRICLITKHEAATGALYAARAKAQGLSLTDLSELSKRAGLQYQMAYRKPGSDIPTPAVIHWKVGHYAAVLDKIGNFYRISDAMDQDIWVRLSAIDDETTGYFLVPSGRLPSGWRSVGVPEGSNVRGRGPTGGNYPPGPGPSNPQAFPAPCGGNGSDGGMTTYNVAAMSVSLELHDRLLSYKPPLGPPVNFEIFYNQRDYQNDGQPGLPYTNFGPNWTSNWISYIDDGLIYYDYLGNVGGGYAWLYLPGGGVETYSFDDYNPKSKPGLLTQALLTKQKIQSSNQEPAKAVSAGVADGALGGLVGAVQGPPNRPPAPLHPNYQFVRELPDGSIQYFSLKAPATDATHFSDRYFLTKVVDPQGYTVSLTYDAMMRITGITDQVGQVTQLQYDLPSDPRKVTSVVDPFGRTAQLVYSSDASRLVKAIDPGGLESSYEYKLVPMIITPGGSTGAEIISSLTTSYGTTSFAPTDIDDGTGNFWRTLTITDPLGLTSRVDQREGAPGISESEPKAQSDALANKGMLVDNSGWLKFRNVFVWDAYQLSLAMKTPNPAVGTAGSAGYLPASPDYTKARLLHFLHQDPQSASFVLESTKNPLENRVWYTYSDQNQSMGPLRSIGSSNQPTAIGRVLDDGTAQITTFQRDNYFGQHITQIIDPIGRQYNFQYDPNNIDLTGIVAGRGATTSTLFKATYNSRHQPLTITDAAGETSIFTYDPQDSQLSTFTNALGQTTKYIYDTPHYLRGIQVSLDNVTFVTQKAFTHDSYGRVYSITDDLGYTKTFTYDVYDRPTNVSFPDGTSDTWSYKYLDVATFTDRMNRQTTYQFDADRELWQVIDPLGRKTQFTYCGCGKISSITDPGNNTTIFNFDIDDRIMSRQYPDGKQTIYSYESTTSRLKSVTDSAGAGPSYTYFSDNTLSTISAASGGPPLVSFKYDPIFLRRTSMTDGSGVTTYTYYPTSAAVSPGATLLQTETSPYGDTVSYTYDALGRPESLTVNGVTSSQTFDAIGRLSVVNNPLGTFSYSYSGASNLVTNVTATSGPQETITYYGVTGDDLPQQISWFGPPSVPAAPSASCLADKATITRLQNEINSDVAWLNQNCGNDWMSGIMNNTSECRQQGPGMISAVNNLNQELSSERTRAMEDCSPPPMRPLLASFGYQYNSDDEVKQISFGGSLVNFRNNGGGPPQTGTYTVSYDDDGELLSVNPVGGGPSDASFAYSYTSAFNIVSEQFGSTTINYSYNNLNQLATAGTSYDADGNLSAFGTTKYGWIPAVSSRPVTLGELDWNLATIQYRNGGATQFRYDGLGRRTEIIELRPGLRAGTREVLSDKRYVWCGFRICEEHDMTAATPSLPGGPVTKTYFPEGVLLYNFYPYFYTLDTQGSVYHVLNPSGAVEAQFQYDPYGNQVQVAGSWRPTDIGYAGVFQHQASGLELAVFRPYSPTLGRWLNRDPLGESPNFAAQGFVTEFPSTNLYSYVSNNPVNFGDTLGLQSIDESNVPLFWEGTPLVWPSAFPYPGYSGAGVPQGLGLGWDVPYGPNVEAWYGNGTWLGLKLSSVSEFFGDYVVSNCIRGCLLSFWDPIQGAYVVGCGPSILPFGGALSAHGLCFADCLLHGLTGPSSP